jgi:hypothetical protein
MTTWVWQRKNDNAGTTRMGDTTNNEADDSEYPRTTYDAPPLLQTRDGGVFLFFPFFFLFFSLSISNIPPLRAPARRVM